MLEGSPSMNGAHPPSFRHADARRARRPARGAAPAPVASVVPAGLWAKLAPPDAKTLSFLSERIPGLNAGAVRVLPLEAADAMFAAAAAQSESPLDFFTDAGFRGDAIYFIAQADIQTIFARYEIHVLTLPVGKHEGRQAVRDAGPGPRRRPRRRPLRPRSVRFREPAVPRPLLQGRLPGDAAHPRPRRRLVEGASGSTPGSSRRRSRASSSSPRPKAASRRTTATEPARHRDPPPLSAGHESLDTPPRHIVINP